MQKIDLTGFNLKKMTTVMTIWGALMLGLLFIGSTAALTYNQPKTAMCSVALAVLIGTIPLYTKRSPNWYYNWLRR